MRLDENTFEEDYKDVLAQIEANSDYGRLRSREKKYMTAAEMGELLGLKKTDRYWLLHQHHFEWEEVLGLFRINIPSFEKWYANQVQYKKVNGEEPGKELKEWSFSPQEIAEEFGINTCCVYEILKKNNIETVTVDYWKRVPKEAFFKWYNSQTRYRMKADREKDAAIENASISMPEMARLLGVTRNTVYSILKHPDYKELFEIITLADRKRITKESFEKFLKNMSLINNYIIPLIGDTKLNDINTRFLEKFYQNMSQMPGHINPISKKGNKYISPSMIRDVHKLLRSAFQQAVKWELMDKNPAAFATTPKCKRKERDIWTAETVMYALEVCEDERWQRCLRLWRRR